MMSEKRFFYKIKEKANVIIDKECHFEIVDMYRACDYLNRLDLKLKHYNKQLGKQQATINKQEKVIDLLMPKKCVDDIYHCKYFCWHRNYNYETCTNDTITLWCDLLDNKETYNRVDGDVIWENGFSNCPLKEMLNNE